MLRDCTKQVRELPRFTLWYLSQNELELTVPTLYVNKSTKILTEVKSSHINAQTGNALRLLSSNFIDKGLRLMALRNELFLKVLKV